MNKKHDPLRCEQCHTESPWLVEVDSAWVGPCCVPDEAWDAYPGWRQREDLRTKRAEIARLNFHKEAA